MKPAIQKSLLKKLVWINTETNFDEIFTIAASWFLWKEKILTVKNLPKKRKATTMNAHRNQPWRNVDDCRFLVSMKVKKPVAVKFVKIYGIIIWKMFPFRLTWFNKISHVKPLWKPNFSYFSPTRKTKFLNS